MITRKNRDQIALMRRAGRVVAEMHERCTRGGEARASRPPRSTGSPARSWTTAAPAPTSSNYHGFPAVICTSPNDVIVHGIPGDVVLEDGDILSLDCGAIIEGWHADAAITVPVGEIDDESQRPDRRHPRARSKRPSSTCGSATRSGEVGAAVQDVAEAGGYSVVREYVGHGIGTAMHEEPQIPNYAGGPNQRYKLKSGLVIAIEPMVNVGRPSTRTLADGWTVVTGDGKRSAHFEHTIAVTDNGPEVLTVPYAAGSVRSPVACGVHLPIYCA